MSQQGKDKNDGLHFLEKLSISQYLTVTFYQEIKLPKYFIKILAEFWFFRILDVISSSLILVIVLRNWILFRRSSITIAVHRGYTTHAYVEDCLRSGWSSDSKWGQTKKAAVDYWVEIEFKNFKGGATAKTWKEISTFSLSIRYRLCRKTILFDIYSPYACLSGTINLKRLFIQALNVYSLK